MKLYFFPGACSLAPHIVLRETGLAFELEQTDLRSKQTASGADYRSINPKGSVPALQLDDGQVLTEVPVIVQYLADLAPEKRLAPAAGSMARYRLMEWLNYICSELHKSFTPLFIPGMPEEAKKLVLERLLARIGYVETQLQAGGHLLGEPFTGADAYLFTVLRWGAKFDIDLGRWPAIHAWFARVGQRPAVQAALAAER